MKRLLLVLSLAAIMAAVMVASALPVFAAPNERASAQSGVSSFEGDTNLGQEVKKQNEDPEAYGGPLGERVSGQGNHGRTTSATK